MYQGLAIYDPDIGSYDQNDGEKLNETTVEESLSCDICGKVLANKKSLYYHRLPFLSVF
jgi:hypothetical protein